MDIVVKYSLFNVGDTAAKDIKVVDNGFRAEDFDLVSGQLKYKLDRISPGANSSQTIVVRPKKFGYFNFTSAEVTYTGEAEGAVLLTGLSSDPGQGVIIAARDYEKQFSAHLVRRPSWADLANHFIVSLSAGLGCLRCDDSALSGNPIPALVVQQVQIRGHLS